MGEIVKRSSKYFPNLIKQFGFSEEEVAELAKDKDPEMKYVGGEDAAST